MDISILHADSNILSQRGLHSILMKGGGISGIETIHDGQLLGTKISEYNPDLLIINYQEAGFFSIENIKFVKDKFPNQKILVISSDQNQNRILKVLELGVSGYLTRECDEDEIVHAVFSIYKGEKFFCNKIINIILEKRLPADGESCAPTILTQRETEVTSLIARGMSNKKIANELFLSIHTIGTHRKNIMKKLGVNSASEIVLYAVNAGLISS